VRTARLARYAFWQLRDFFAEKSFPILLVVALAGYLDLAPLIAQYGRPDASHPYPIYLTVFARTMLTLAIIGTLFTTRGIVSDDRQQGYYRFLFAKPLSVSRFYAQKFVVYGFGFLGVSAILLGVHAAAIAPFAPPALVLAMLSLYVAVGGIGFLASALFRFDWAVLGGFLVGSALLWGSWSERGGWRGSVLYALPPIHRAGDVLSAATSGVTLPWLHAAWLTGYGLVCFVLALLVLRRRSLAGA
jgi:ABC-type transport system involved in multi-copper enzyme maturation permease subunit